jgi:hypothetical protein
MQKLITLAFIMGLSAMAAQAMPLVPQAGTSMIVKVAQGCPIGFHRGPLGGCVRNGAGPVVVAPRPVVVAPGPVVVVPRVGPCGGRGQHEVCVIGRGCRMVCN